LELLIGVERTYGARSGTFFADAGRCGARQEDVRMLSPLSILSPDQGRLHAQGLVARISAQDREAATEDPATARPADVPRPLLLRLLAALSRHPA
jgi:hypothetical protein